MWELVFTILKNYTSENIVGKGEIAYDKQFLLFPQCFPPYKIFIFQCKLTLICRLQTSFKLDPSKIVLYGKDLNIKRIYI